MKLQSLLHTALILLSISSAHAANPYPVAGQCDGLPAVKLSTPANTCVGVVASDLKMPRGILPLADDVLLVTEMGSWEKGHGRLSRLLWQNGAYQRTTLLDGLDRPHSVLLGADGWVYIGEASRIVRINPQTLSSNARENHVEVVLDHMPDDGHHPLKQMLFDAAGNLYISMGAKTDHCENTDDTAPRYPCAETQGAQATATIWKVTSLLDHPQTQIWASGLRNAMGMAWAVDGQSMIATDNGRDFINQGNAKLSDALLPHDEIDAVHAGGDYGWPYCYDNNALNPEYSKRPQACQGKIPPMQFLPAHSAPLGIIRYPTDGGISALRGLYLVALHGYRDTGHRIVALNADANGQPTGKIMDIIANWGATGKQPMGAPVELHPSPSGKLYITDDRNGVVLRLANGR